MVCFPALPEQSSAGDGRGGSQHLMKSPKSVTKQKRAGTGFQKWNKVRN